MYLLIKNAHIATMDARNPFSQAAVINGEYFVFVGSNEDAVSFISRRTNQYDVIDMQGKLLIPGFNDSHLHYLHYVKNRYLSVDLSGSTSFAEMMSTMRSDCEVRNLKAGEWLICEGWNQDKFSDEKRFPTAADLDEISRDIPIIAMRVCFHVGVLNTKAMELIGLDREKAAELGEYAGKFDDGSPNGILKEYIFDNIKQELPAPDVDELVEMMIRGQNDLFALGITSIQSDDLKYVVGGHAYDLLEKLRAASQSGRLKVRMSEQCLFDTPESYSAFYDRGFDNSFGTKGFDISCIKLLQDGSLGARTALMSEPYADDPENHGIAIHPQDELNSMVAEAHKRNIAVAIHAIGDKAISMALSAIETAKVDMPYFNPHHGIVHCQITDRQLLERFSKVGVAALVQPVFIDYDMDICEARVGAAKAATSYAWRTLLSSGVITAFGTDCPVEPLDPMRGIWCAVTRRKLNGSATFNANEAISLSEALYCYTAAGAAIQRKAHIKGQIRAGMLADFVVLDRNLFTLPYDEILNTRVLKTYIGGQAVYVA